jgi:phosphate transport system permease protein
MARNWEEFLVEKVLLLAAISSIIIILLIIGFVIQQGLPAME